jgi:hypothetical protein
MIAFGFDIKNGLRNFADDELWWDLLLVLLGFINGRH